MLESLTDANKEFHIAGSDESNFEDILAGLECRARFRARVDKRAVRDHLMTNNACDYPPVFNGC